MRTSEIVGRRLVTFGAVLLMGGVASGVVALSMVNVGIENQLTGGDSTALAESVAVLDQLGDERQRLLYTLWIAEVHAAGDTRLENTLRQRREQYDSYQETIVSESEVREPDAAAQEVEEAAPPPTQVVSYVDQFDDLILKHSRVAGVSPYLVKAVMRWESNMNPLAISRARCVGLMQVHPIHFENFGLTVATAFDPDANIHAGVTILAEYMRRFDGRVRRALIGYVAGPNKADRIATALDAGRHVSSEITDYLARIADSFDEYHRAQSFEPRVQRAR